VLVGMTGVGGGSLMTPMDLHAMGWLLQPRTAAAESERG